MVYLSCIKGKFYFIRFNYNHIRPTSQKNLEYGINLEEP